MTPALLLVDVQADFLDRQGLTPAKAVLAGQCARLLHECRLLGIPIFHVHTLVRPDGSDRMPHWKRGGVWACVEGTPGAEPPPALAPADREPVVRKTFFSAFSNPELDPALGSRGIDTVVIAGVYLQSCVRATALDAYQRGYDVMIAADAVGSTEPMHAALSQRYLEGRVAALFPTDVLIGRISGSQAKRKVPPSPVFPVSYAGGAWRKESGDAYLVKRNPSRWHEILGAVPMASGAIVADCAVAAAVAARDWGGADVDWRVSFLESWEQSLASRERQLMRTMAIEIGKPVGDVKEEIARALALIDVAGRVARQRPETVAGSAKSVRSSRRPLGAVALITPWNNPVGIPVGKIAPALAFGNAVLWKPSWQVPQTSMLVAESLIEAGIPKGVFNMVMGDAETAEAMILAPEIAGVSLTGAQATGQRANLLCAEAGKVLQAELGGNNAAIVMPDCDLARFAQSFARAAFGFAGQRCTATRRFILLEENRASFEDAFAAAVKSLTMGAPENPGTQIGPVISMESRARLRDVVADAVTRGARTVVPGGDGEPPGDGCWFKPVVLACDDPEAPVVREESFGPVAVIQTARDIESAIALLNAVPQGLVATLYSDDPGHQRRFLEEAQAGILRLNETRFEIDPQAAFGGWKASGMGPPEHGIWDEAFYSRVQARYGFPPESE